MISLKKHPTFILYTSINPDPSVIWKDFPLYLLPFLGTFNVKISSGYIHKSKLRMEAGQRNRVGCRLYTFTSESISPFSSLTPSSWVNILSEWETLRSKIRTSWERNRINEIKIQASLTFAAGNQGLKKQLKSLGTCEVDYTECKSGSWCKSDYKYRVWTSLLVNPGLETKILNIFIVKKNTHTSSTLCEMPTWF